MNNTHEGDSFRVPHIIRFRVSKGQQQAGTNEEMEAFGMGCGTAILAVAQSMWRPMDAA
jgi:hypothetical protein